MNKVSMEHRGGRFLEVNKDLPVTCGMMPDGPNPRFPKQSAGPSYRENESRKAVHSLLYLDAQESTTCRKS
jgi:hypothetical protein